MHGWDHRKGGMDPIPGLGASGLSWAFITSNGTPVSCPAGLSTRIAASSSTFYTNASSTFDAQNSSGGVMGMRILADGHYAFWMSALPLSGLAAGDNIDLVTEGGGEVPDFFMGTPDFFFPTGGSIASANLVSSGLMSVGSFISAPTAAIVCRIDNLSSTHSASVYYTGLTVVQLDSAVQDLG